MTEILPEKSLSKCCDICSEIRYWATIVGFFLKGWRYRIFFLLLGWQLLLATGTDSS